MENADYTRAAFLINDPAVATSEHDSLMTWLVGNIDAVCEKLFPVDQVWRAHHAATGRSEALASAEGLVQWLDRVQTEVVEGPVAEGEAAQFRFSAATRKAAEEKAAHVRAWVKAGELPEVPKELWAFNVDSYEVMRRVSLEGALRSGEKMRGFIHVSALGSELVSLRMSGSYLLCWKFDRLQLGPGSCTVEEDVREAVGGIDLTSMQWCRDEEDVEVWFHVRTGAFTLCEILRELKLLWELELGKQRVVLCVRSIESSMREAIKKEGFLVVEAESGKH